MEEGAVDYLHQERKKQKAWVIISFHAYENFLQYNLFASRYYSQNNMRVSTAIANTLQ